MKLNRTLAGTSLATLALTATAAVAAPTGSTAAPVAAAPVAAPSASSASEAAAESAASARATALSARLGAGSAGSWLDAAGRMVVAVTTDAAAATVRSSGAVAVRVAHSAAELDAATRTLAATADVPGSAWGVDPVANTVVVSVDSTVTGSRLAKVRAAVAGLGSKARLESVPGRFTPVIAGGQAIYTGQSRCSLGFNVRSGSTYYFLTAGHCTNVGSTWYSNSGRTALLGTRTGTSFPGNDYGIVRYASSSPTPPGTVFTYNGSQDITSAATPGVGTNVRRSGSTTGVHTGTVTQLNSRVNYQEGSVSGLIRTTVCAEPGDSGGPLYSGTTAYGLTSGGNGDCRSGGTTYFQPVTEALSAYGVSVY